jgi:hypothetical protein
MLASSVVSATFSARQVQSSCNIGRMLWATSSAGSHVATSDASHLRDQMRSASCVLHPHLRYTSVVQVRQKVTHELWNTL